MGNFTTWRPGSHGRPAELLSATESRSAHLLQRHADRALGCRHVRQADGIMGAVKSWGVEPGLVLWIA